MEIIDLIMNIISPYSCLVCGEEGSVLCPPCSTAELMSCSTNCFGCKALTKNFETCSKCKKSVPLKNVWVACDYRGLAKRIIHKYKYDCARGADSVIISSMERLIPRTDFLVTNIPTSPEAIRLRGFDHSARIAKKLAVKKKFLYSPLLVRTHNKKQVGSNRTLRIKQTENLFIARSFENTAPESVLIVDDVATTGSTLVSAAKALKAAGVKNVYGLVFARKL